MIFIGVVVVAVIVIILVLLQLWSKFIFWVIGAILGIWVALGVVLLENYVIVLVVFVVAAVEIAVIVVAGVVAEPATLELAQYSALICP